MLTKVKLRQKPLADGKLSLYLDFYPPITDQVTGKKTRREFLQRQHNATPHTHIPRRLDSEIS